jgi:hypothetical protein
VRNSRHPSGPALIYTRAEVAAFLAGVKHGEFDDLCLGGSVVLLPERSGNGVLVGGSAVISSVCTPRCRPGGAVAPW